MTGWNMPPGVNEKDIPGNSKIDLLYEKEFEKYCDNCGECDPWHDDCHREKEFEKIFEEILELY